MKMPFGKYKGIEFDDVPESYLRWCLQNIELSAKLERAVRERLGIETPERPNTTSKRRPTLPIERRELDTKVKSWFRELAMTYHPDRRGGSNEAMAALIDATERPPAGSRWVRESAESPTSR